MPYNAEEAKAYIEKVFEESLIKSLSDFITIPNLSRGYDEHYATNGLLEKAANHIRDWVLQLGISGLTSEIITHPGYTPILFT